MKSILYNPMNDKIRHNIELECFELLAETFGQGAELYSTGELKSQGFGKYSERLLLKKSGLVGVSITGNQEHLSTDDQFPFKKINEELKLNYFNGKLTVTIKNLVKENYFNGAKITYPQTGLVNTIRKNEDFKKTKEADQIIAATTNCTILPHASYLFACKNALTTETAIDLVNNTWNSSFLITESLAVKSGISDDSMVLFIRIDSGSNTNYNNLLLNRLDFLIENQAIVSKILETGLFVGDFNFDFTPVREYIRNEGMQIIGYTAYHESYAADTISQMVANRESDGISRLVEFNKGLPIFI
jgi:hypothetical protein